MAAHCIVMEQVCMLFGSQMYTSWHIEFSRTGATINCMLVLTSDSSPWLQITQLYEMIIVRHGLMLVGAPFSGKSVGLKLLAGALTDLNAEGKQGTLFEKVEMRVINPKSVTMGQLYGEVDRATQEWKVSS